MAKLKKEELIQLKAIVDSISNLQGQVGAIEFRKHQLIEGLQRSQEALDQSLASLKETYGNVNIDIETGELTEPKSE